MNNFYAVNVRPWILAARSLMPRRPIITDTKNAEHAMNILGVKISVDHATSSKAKWTRRAMVLLAANAIVLAGGSAYAFWTSTGTGTGASAAGTLTLNITAVGSTASNQKLFPGAITGGSGATVGGDISFTVSNPQNFPVKVTAIQQNGAVTQSGGSGSPACTSDVAGTGTNIASFGNSGVWIGSTQPTGTNPTVYPSVSLTGVTVPANATNALLTITNVVTMSSGSANGCQGATFSVPALLSISQ